MVVTGQFHAPLLIRSEVGCVEHDCPEDGGKQEGLTITGNRMPVVQPRTRLSYTIGYVAVPMLQI
jgi:hypothetical protein